MRALRWVPFGWMWLVGCGSAAVTAPVERTVEPSRPAAQGDEDVAAEDAAVESPREVPVRAGDRIAVPGSVEQSAELPAALVTWLRALLTAPPAEQDSRIDWERATLVRQASAASLGGGAAAPERGAGLGLRVPEGCEPAFEARPGYSILAFPPAVVDLDEAAAQAVQRAVSALHEGQEILVLCPYLHGDEAVEDGQTTVRREVRPAPAFVLNVIPRGAAWRVQAWAWLGGSEDTVAP